MKHYWVWHGGEKQYEECAHCGLRRRRRIADVRAVNRARSWYRITEYARPGGFWKWVRRRERIPSCR